MGCLLFYIKNNQLYLYYKKNDYLCSNYKPMKPIIMKQENEFLHLIRRLMLTLLIGLPVVLAGCHDNDDEFNYVGEYNYSVCVMNADYSMQVVLDSVNSQVSSISADDDWVKCSDEGFDDEGHPIVKLDVKGSEDGKKRETELRLHMADQHLVRLQVKQSMFYSSKDWDRANADTSFTYNNWYDEKKTTIIVTDEKGNPFEVYLPWASGANTSMPADYLNVNEYYAEWRLCFNFCNDKFAGNHNMFGLFNINTQIMRIYVYFFEPPSAASRSYFEVSMKDSVSAIIASDNLCWGLDMETAKNGKWKQALRNNNGYPYSIIIPPICGNENATINAGWVAFDIPMNTFVGNIDDALHHLDRKINITLHSATVTETKATQDFSKLLLNSKDIKVISPGSASKCAKAVASTVFEGLKGLGDIITSIATTPNAQAGALAGVIKGIGLLGNVGLGISDAANAAKDQVAYKMEMEFNFSGETEINATSITLTANSFGGITMYVGTMFEEMLKELRIIDKNESYSPLKKIDLKKLDLGIWNLAETPTIYVSEDILFRTSDLGTAYNCDGENVSAFGGDEGLIYASFLDPSSIKLVLNTNENFYPYSKVDSIKLIGYDFVIQLTPYNYDDPYYTYFNTPNEYVTLTTETDSWNNIFTGNDSKSMRLVPINHKELLLDMTQKPEYVDSIPYNTADSLGFMYKIGGIKSNFGTDLLRPYECVYSPFIYVPHNSQHIYPNKAPLGHVGVVAVLELQVAGKKYFYARRFLPKIEILKKENIKALRQKMDNFRMKDYNNLKAVNYTLFDKQKAKAERIIQIIQKTE